MKYSKFDDIDAILLSAEKQIGEIEKEYKRSLEMKSGSGPLPLINHFLQDLRSALDYAAHKFPGRQDNFPVCETAADFNNRAASWPTPLRDIVEKLQPFSGNSWLKNFNLLNNKRKHFTLKPETRTETAQTIVSHPNGGSVSWTDAVTFGSGVQIMGVPIDPSTQMPVPNKVVRVERIIWVNFLFDNTAVPGLPANIPVLPFLKESFKKIIEFLPQIEALL